MSLQGAVEHQSRCVWLRSGVKQQGLAPFQFPCIFGIGLFNRPKFGKLAEPESVKNPSVRGERSTHEIFRTF